MEHMTSSQDAVSSPLPLQLQAIFKAFFDLYFQLDESGAIVAYGAAHDRDLFLPPADFLGRRMEDVLPPDVGAQFHEAIARVRQSGETAPCEYSLPLGDEANATERTV